MKGKRLALVYVFGLLLLLVATILPSACSPQAGTTTAAPAPSKTAAPAVIVWKINTNMPLNDPDDLGAIYYGNAVTAASNGRLKFEVHPNSELFAAPNTLDGLSQNAIQVGVLPPANVAGFIPEASIAAGIPGVMKSRVDMDMLWEVKGVHKIVDEAFREKGAIMLSQATYGDVPIWSKKPLKVMADFKGLKIRALGDMSKILTDWGAEITNVNLPESYTALQLGTIDAFSTGLSGFLSLKHYEVTKYITMPALNAVGVTCLAVSLPAFNALPDDLKGIVSAAAQDWNLMYSTLRLRGEESVIKDPGRYGMTIVELDPALQQAATGWGVKLLDGYIAKGGRVAQLAQIHKDYMKEVGYIK